MVQQTHESTPRKNVACISIKAIASQPAKGLESLGNAQMRRII
jgi:hypothetical protein